MSTDLTQCPEFLALHQRVQQLERLVHQLITQPHKPAGAPPSNIWEDLDAGQALIPLASLGEYLSWLPRKNGKIPVKQTFYQWKNRPKNPLEVIAGAHEFCTTDNAVRRFMRIPPAGFVNPQLPPLDRRQFNW